MSSFDKSLVQRDRWDGGDWWRKINGKHRSEMERGVWSLSWWPASNNFSFKSHGWIFRYFQHFGARHTMSACRWNEDGMLVDVTSWGRSCLRGLCCSHCSHIAAASFCKLMDQFKHLWVIYNEICVSKDRVEKKIWIYPWRKLLLLKCTKESHIYIYYL